MPISGGRKGFQFQTNQQTNNHFGTDYTDFPLITFPVGGADPDYPNNPGWKRVAELPIYNRYRGTNGIEATLGYYPVYFRNSQDAGNSLRSRAQITTQSPIGIINSGLQIWEMGTIFIGYPNARIDNIVDLTTPPDCLFISNRVGINTPLEPSTFGNNFLNPKGLLDINPGLNEEAIQLILRGVFTPQSAEDPRGVPGSIVPGSPGIFHIKGSNNKWYSFTGVAPGNVPFELNEISLENDFTGNQQIFNFITLRQLLTETSNSPTGTFNISSYPNINEGVINSGAATALNILNLRNHYPSNTDRGTISELRGIDLRYGSEAVEAANSPGITNCYGLRLTPYLAAGITANIYDLFIGSHVAGGSNNNHYGIYISNISSAPTNNNYAIYTNLGRIRFGDNVILAEGKNLQFGTTTGSVIGQVSNQKLSFWGQTPTAQPDSYAQNYSIATRVLNTYPAPQGGNSFAGISNSQSGSVFASVADLNTVYAETQSIRNSLTNLVQITNSLIDDHQLMGLCNPATPVIVTPPSFIAFSSASAGATAASSISLTIPSGTQSGDLLIAFLVHNHPQGGVAPPSGWTLIRLQSNTGTSNLPVRSEVYWKLAGASEPSAVFSSPGNAGLVFTATISSFRNVDPTAPIQAEFFASIADPSTNYALSNIATNKANSLIFFAVGARNNTTLPATINNWTTPADMTEVIEVTPDTNTGRRIQAISYQIVTTAQTLTKSATGPGGYGAINAIVINPKP